MVARILTGELNAAAEDGVSWVSEICRKLTIPSLGSCRIREHDVPLLVEKASKASSMKGNPIVLTPAELREVLTRAM
jgi:alcohol dehydrogenase class IV